MINSLCPTLGPCTFCLTQCPDDNNVFYSKLAFCHIKIDLKKERLNEGLDNTSGCGAEKTS